MMHSSHIVLIGGLHSGKSTLVRHALTELAIDFLGVLSEPIRRENEIAGYGLRMVGRPGLLVFAHVNIASSQRFDKYGIDLTPFARAAEYVETALLQRPRLFVIDEIGPIEDAVPQYKLAVDRLFASTVASLVVVQERAAYLQEIKAKQDVLLLELANNHVLLAGQIIHLLKEITNPDRRIDGE
ncbi:hypothetical protein JXA02_07725 [candidate division KSB1 bacterium]|nr:hypothetical protein [candidate division KSB1 bacterium]RQW06263.1 MAG: hypothetical protein EH222_08985 [candidate division KSB1 bacterium]